MRTFKIIETKEGFSCYKRFLFFFWEPAITWKGTEDIFYFKTFDNAWKNLCREYDILQNEKVNLKIKLLTEKRN